MLSTLLPKRLVTALRFLTVLPLAPKGEETEEDLAGSVSWFPAAGLIIGIIIAVADAIMRSFLPTAPASAITVALLAVITGFLHLDGLADLADGLASRKRGEDLIEVMHDSRIGATGAAALVAALLVKFSTIMSLEASCRYNALILCPMLARWAMTGMIYDMALPSATGLAAPFTRGVTRGQIKTAGIFALILSLIVWGFKGIVVLAVVSAAALVFRGMAKRFAGGATGDMIGAGGELCEILGFAMAVILC